MTEKWYLRTQDDTFGPETRERLIEWAKMGRIQPGQEISSDGENWQPAIEIPFLDMRWSIDIGDGTPRGPFNRFAAEALLRSGRLPAASRMIEVEPAFATEPDEPEPQPDAPAEPESQPDNSAEQEPQATPSTESEDEDATEPDGSDISETAADSNAAAPQPVRHGEDVRVVEKIVKVPVEVIKEVVREVPVEVVKEVVKEVPVEKVVVQEKVVEVESAALLAKVAALEAEVATAKRETLTLESEIRRLPSNAKEAADTEAAIYWLLRGEADDLAKVIAEEKADAEAAQMRWNERMDKLSARRVEILKRIGDDENDMKSRTLRANPADPRTVQLRQELDALRLVAEKNAYESGQRIKELTRELNEKTTQADRLASQLADVKRLQVQIQDLRERLQVRERELMSERQANEELRRAAEASQQTLLKRLSELEASMPVRPAQSGNSHSETSRFPSWMKLKK